MTITLVATPDPEPFDIHAQPTWIALGIGRIHRDYPEAKPSSVSRELDVAWVALADTEHRYHACLVKDANSGTGHVVYVDEVAR